MSDLTDDLLRFLVRINGRIAFPHEELRQLVVPSAKQKKQLKAYNLCDGSKKLSEIAKSTGLDQGNFSRTVSRWEQLGIVSRIGPDKNPLHLYPLSE